MVLKPGSVALVVLMLLGVISVSGYWLIPIVAFCLAFWTSSLAAQAVHK